MAPSSRSASPVLPKKTDPDNLADWFKSPLPTFSFWLSIRSDGPDLLPSSIRVKESLWRKFILFLSSESIRLDRCSERDLARFFTISSIEKDQPKRYAHLIGEVFSHLERIGWKGKNPGDMARMAGITRGENDAARFLSGEQQEILEKVIREEITKGITSARKVEPSQWVSVRDAAVTAVMFGAGCRVVEVGALTVNCTSQWGVLDIPNIPHVDGSPFILEHQSILLPVASDALKVWLKMRRALDAPAYSRLFMADIDRRRNDVHPASDAMHPATLFRRTRSLLASAGITGTRASGQILRNTYGAMLIEAGTSDDKLQDAMGLKSFESVVRLRNAYDKWLTSGEEV